MFGDAHGSIALHVGVSADAEQAGVGASDVASDEQQVGEFADVVDGVLVLCQAHGPARDRAATLRQQRGGLLDLRALNARLADNQIKFCRFDVPPVLVKAAGMRGNEVFIDRVVG